MKQTFDARQRALHRPLPGGVAGAARGATFLLFWTLCAALMAGIAAEARAAHWQYLTVPGDTLIGIGQRYLKNPDDWPKVQAENRVEIPRRMPTGFRLRIPVALLKVTPAPVEVVAVQGNVRVRAAGQGADAPRFQPLTAGSRLHGGESVVTGPGSSASFRFADGTQLTQQAGSRLSFGRLAAYGPTGMIATELALESGRIEAQAARQVQPAGGFTVRTAVAVAGLRGTAFRVSMAEDGTRMTSEVTTGEVSVSAQGRSVAVSAGFGTLTEQGRAPAAPRALLPAPDLSALPTLIHTWPLRFDKPAQPGAVAWRARIAREAAFTHVVLDDVFTGQTAQWQQTLPDGEYHLRVRAIDALGLEGLEAVHRFTVATEAPPPAPVSPALGERLRQHDTLLRWGAVPDARGYVLQLAPTPEFGPGLIERHLPPVTQHPETLAEGEWHWRVAHLDQAGRQHRFSPHRAFLVQPLPLAPAGARGRAEAGQASFTWQPVGGAQRYELEIRGDQAEGRHLTPDATPALTLALAPGRHTWRVRGLEAGGEAGAWSAPGVLLVPPHAPTALRVSTPQRVPVLSWQGEAERFRVEVGTHDDPLFASPVLRLETTARQTELRDLPAGDYRARVIALGVEGVAGPPSASLAFKAAAALPWWWCVLPLFLLP